MAAAVFLTRQGRSESEIKQYITETFAYKLDQSLDQIRPHYRFDETCQRSVPQLIIAFLESTRYEDALRKGSRSAAMPIP